MATVTDHPLFPTHTVGSAPEGARRAMAGTAKQLGAVPDAVGRLATSPELLTAFLQASHLFEHTTLDPIAREVVVMAIATRHGCHICVAMHSARLAALGVPAATSEQLRSGAALSDERLETLRAFTVAVMDRAGAVDDESLRAFTEAGFTPRQALEVVLGVGAYTMSALANRLTRAPLDPSLDAYAWEPPAA